MWRNSRMMPVGQLVPALPIPGFNPSSTPKTYAAWPVWSGSTQAEIRGIPLSKKEAWRRWYKARDFDRQTHERGKHGGVIGRIGLAVLQALVDTLNYSTGRLDPALDTIAEKARACRRSVVTHLQRLRELGIVGWINRRRKETDAEGRVQWVQETNFYFFQSPENWKGWREPPPAPPPEPGTWGDHPPLPDTIAQAAAELGHGQRRAALEALASDPTNEVAVALARLGQTMNSAVVLAPPPKPSPPDVERRQRAHEEWLHAVWLEAQRTMPKERFVAFTAALLEEEPPRWALDEMDRLDQRIRARKAR